MAQREREREAIVYKTIPSRKKQKIENKNAENNVIKQSATKTERIKHLNTTFKFEI